MSQVANPHIAKKITWLYLLALTAVALLTIGGQLLVQRSLRRQQNDSRVVNIAGRQRMLSQKISKTVLLLQNHPDSTQASIYVADLTEALDLWKKNHDGLKDGYLAYVQTPVHNSAAISNMLTQIDPLFQAIYTNARFISSSYKAEKLKALPAFSKESQFILSNERLFLKGMDQIVSQYDIEATNRVNYSQNIEYILLFCTLGILLLEGLFIFRPAVNQIQYTIGLLINSERRTQKINEELVQANKSLEETREALLEATNQKYLQQMNEQKLRAAYLIEGQEEERKRVAREIHDGLGQMLTALKFGIERIGDNLNDSETARNNMAGLQDLISQTISEARTISFNLMPAVLSDFGISSALKLLTAQVAANANVNVTFNTNWNGKRLLKNTEIGLYRVSQEALHNAVKYAGAKDITVELWSKKKYLHLTIADNGKGFKQERLAAQPKKTGLAHGISNMKERVSMINGEIEINSKAGKGTQINVKAPLL
ncbi:ATP-binding protein [Adhaeribacter aquaticus]|uniref:ATP-binding protein n=1 Tax=Adhaeribacter aquaticus TaxID=299567 RepID=UPI0004169698|nr:ATP-binding protein [Adhaeribacter aquaticus]